MLDYKLANIHLEYEMIHRKNLAEEAYSTYTSGKEFAYDHVMQEEMLTFEKRHKHTGKYRGKPSAPLHEGFPTALY